MDPLALYGDTKEIVEMLKSIKDRYDAIKQNIPSATLLINTYRLLADRLKYMSENHRETISRFSDYDAVSLEERIEELNTTFAAAFKQLRTELAKLEKWRFYRITRAKRTEALLSAMQQDANYAKEKLDRIQDMLTTISSLIPRSELTDCFRYCNTAPPNEAFIVLDFDTLDDDGIPLTCEGRLKAALLMSSDGQSVGAVASGMGGVGKTCTLRALAYDPDVMKRFPDAICFVSLGMDATVANLMERLCSLVEATGGEKRAEELRRETDLPTLLEKVRNWFCGYVCLFMFDDVWCSTSTAHGIKRDILWKLLILASRSGSQGGSRLVYSTRDQQSLTSLGEIVSFEPKDRRGTAASKILLQCAGAGENELHDSICKEAIENILDHCAGLPVALNIAGRIVRWKKEKWKGDKKEPWIAYWNALKDHGILEADTTSSYGKIGPSLIVSLNFLDQDSLRSVLGIPFREVHRALCVMQKQDWISCGVLRKLCGMKDDELAKKAIEAMGTVGVVYEEHRLVHGKECVGLRLHDLVHDFARKEAEKSDEVAMWHTQLIDNTMEEMGASRDDSWWPVLLPENSYVFRNICRLLHEAGLGERVWSLLLSAEWIVKMTQMGSVRRLEEDIALCTKRHDDSEKANSLRMVGKAVRLSASYCADAPAVAWFQLFARLLASSKGSAVLRGFLEKIEENAPRPWLRPTKTCVKSVSEALVDMFEVGGNARGVGFMENAVVCCYTKARMRPDSCDFGMTKLCSEGTRLDFACCGESDSGFSFLDQTISFEEQHRLALSSRGESGPSRATKITRVAIGKDCRYAVTANSNGLVRIWNILTLIPQGEPDTFHKSSVECVAISSRGIRAVSCSDNSLWIWKGETGKQEGIALTAHGHEIHFVSISNNGNWIVSTAKDGLCVWDAESRSCLCAIELNGYCATAAISENGKKIVCGVENVVTTIDTEKRQIEKVLGQSESRIRRTDMSCDGRLVVSGSADGTVLVFDVDAGRQVANFKGHTDIVMSVSIRNDKKRVVSGSIDRTVCVWNPEKLVEARILPSGHEYMVQYVAVCADGRFVVSQDLFNMRTWSVDSGVSSLSAPPISQRETSVVSVTKRGDRMVFGTKFGRVRVWKNESVKRWKWPLEMEDHSYREHYFAKDPCGTLQKTSYLGVVSRDEDNKLRLFKNNYESPVLTALPDPREEVSSVGMFDDLGDLFVALGLKGGNILLWQEGKDSFADPLVGHADEVRCLIFSSYFDPDFLVSGSADKSILVWDYSHQRIREKFVGHTERVCCLSVCYEERIVASGSDDTTVRVWDLDNIGRECLTLRGHSGSVCCVAINNNGDRVVSGSNDNIDNTVRVWDVRKGNSIHCIHQTSILSVGISENGQEIMCISTDNKTVQWWDAESAKLLGVEVGGHMGEIQKLATSPDGNRMAVLSCPTQEYKNWNPKGVSESQQLRVWDLEKMQCIYVGAENEWNEITCGFVVDGIRTNEAESQMLDFRIGENRRTIVHGDRIVAISESDIHSFDVDYKNKVATAGHFHGEIAIFKIV